MDDIYGRLFFLAIGAFSVWAVNRLTERTKANIQDQISLRNSYAKWLSSSRMFLLQSSRVKAQVLSSSPLTEKASVNAQLESLMRLSEQTSHAMYEVFLLERRKLVRHGLLGLTERFTEIMDLINLLQTLIEQRSQMSELDNNTVAKQEYLKHDLGEEVVGLLAETVSRFDELIEKLASKIGSARSAYQDMQSEFLDLLDRTPNTRWYTWRMNAETEMIDREFRDSASSISYDDEKTA